MHVIVEREREKKQANLYNNKRRRPSSSTETHYFVCIGIETFLKSWETRALVIALINFLHLLFINCKMHYRGRDAEVGR